MMFSERQGPCSIFEKVPCNTYLSNGRIYSLFAREEGGTNPFKTYDCCLKCEADTQLTKLICTQVMLERTKTFAINESAKKM